MKGQMLITAIIVVVLIAVVIWLYGIFSNVFIEEFLPSVNSTIEELNKTEVKEVRQTATTAWIWGPLLLIIGLVALLFFIALRREYSPEHY